MWLPRQAITVDVTVNNNPGISAGAFRINFDSSVLQLVGAKPGDFPGLTQIDRKFVWCNSSEIAYDGVIARLVFRVIGDSFVRVPVSVTCGGGDFSNSVEQRIIFESYSGSVTRRCGFAAPPFRVFLSHSPPHLPPDIDSPTVI